MSRESIARFISACAENAALGRELAAAERTLGAWVAVGEKAGFVFTAEELHRLVEELAGRSLEAGDVISVLLARASKSLSDRELDAVSGGVGDLGSWAKVDGLDVSFSSAHLNTVLSRFKGEVDHE